MDALRADYHRVRSEYVYLTSLLLSTLSFQLIGLFVCLLNKFHQQNNHTMVGGVYVRGLLGFGMYRHVCAYVCACVCVCLCGGVGVVYGCRLSYYLCDLGESIEGHGGTHQH
jgi:hypothetical protein